MSDIFLSYATEDREKAQTLVDALERSGWSVFWDRTIPAGTAWRKAIESELEKAGSVLALWSTKSIHSTWVQEEAQEAQDRNILIPLLIEPVTPPIGFRHLQSEDFTDWDGDPMCEPFERLAAVIRRLLSDRTDNAAKGEDQERHQTRPGPSSLPTPLRGPVNKLLGRLIRDYESPDSQPPPKTFLLEELGLANLHHTYTALGCSDLESRSHGDIDSVLQEWYLDDTRRSLLLLGDFGSGKTSTCLKLTYWAAKTWMRGENAIRVPLFVPLRKCRGQGGIIPGIQDVLTVDYDLPFRDRSSLKQFLASSQAVLILDGFDELSLLGDDRTLNRLFAEVARLFRRESKLLVTCRTHYFKSDTTVRDLFAPAPRAKSLQILSTAPSFEIVCLNELTIDQIKAIAKPQVSDLDAFLNVVSRVYDLPDLAKRPIFLKMIIGNYQGAHGQHQGLITSATLYQYYIEAWARSQRLRSQLLVTDKLKLLEQLAYLMFRSERHQIDPKELEGALGEWLSLPELKLEDGGADIRTTSLLVRDSKGNYYFAHQSFLEYLAARFIFDDIVNGELGSLREEFYSPVVCSFIASMLSVQEYASLFAQLEATEERNVAHNILRLIGARSWDNGDLVGKLADYCDREENLDVRSQAAEIAFQLGVRTPLLNYVKEAPEYSTHRDDTPIQHRLMTEKNAPFDRSDDEIEDLLKKGLLRCQSPIVTRQFIIWLTRFQVSDCQEALLRLFRDESVDTRTRRYALSALGLLPHKDKNTIIESLKKACQHLVADLADDCRIAINRLGGGNQVVSPE